MQGDLKVFPTSRAIRGYISSALDGNTFLPTCITISDFFRNSLSFPNKSSISAEKRFLLLKQATDNVDITKLALSNNFTTFLKQSDYIFRFFDELSSESVDINSLKLADIYEEYIEHLTILENLYKEFSNLLAKNSFIDRTNMTGSYVLNNNYLSRYDSITIYLQGFLTKFEYKVLDEISLSYNINLVFKTNIYNIDFLHEMFGVKFDNNSDIVFNLSSKKIESSLKSRKPIQAVNISGLSNKIAQVAFVKSSIYEMINRGIKAENIAVILPDESFAEYLEVFDNEKYFNFAMGKSVKNNIYYKKLNALIEYLNDSNIRTKEKLDFFGLDIKRVDDELKPIYFKPLTKQNFTLFLSLIGECEKELQEKIDEIVYKLDILLYNGDEILLSNAIKLFFDNVSNISFDDVMGGKITVMGLLETRGVSFDGVIVVDFNDDKAPKRSVKDKFLSSHIKELVNLPTPQKRQNLQKYYYKTLFDNAKDVRISYIDDEQNMISRFAKELFDDSLITKNTQYSSILYSSTKLDKKNYEYVLEIDLSKFAFSATSLKDLLDCKRKYLYKHIYKIKDHTISLMPKGYETGTVIHKILQNLFVKHKNLYDYKEIKQAIDFEISLEQNLVKNPMLELDLELYRRSLYKFAHIQEKRFQDGYTVVDTEKRFSVLHGGIKLEGVIDRIDRKAGAFYIIDYKTSQSLKVDTPKTYKETSDFQLEFYALGLGGQNVQEASYYDVNRGVFLKEEMLEEKLILLDEILQTLHTTSVNFEQTTKKATCEFCPYKTICGIK